ncbi:MAG: hypothetical protein ABSG41_24670 [Bryobacteraceae bacterium]
MTISDRDRRALVILALGLAVAGVLRFVFSDSMSTVSVASANVSEDRIGLARQRLVRLRQVAATLPAREAAMKQTASDLADRERGIIQADTAPQAQAALLEIARRIGKNDQIDVRGGDFGAPKAFGDYGLVYTTITFECHIEQFVNFLADLSHEPELVVPSEERIASGNPKEKTMNVRVVLAGVVAKKLVPEKKGLAAF